MPLARGQRIKSKEKDVMEGHTSGGGGGSYVVFVLAIAVRGMRTFYRNPMFRYSRGC